MAVVPVADVTQHQSDSVESKGTSEKQRNRALLVKQTIIDQMRDPLQSRWNADIIRESKNAGPGETNADDLVHSIDFGRMNSFFQNFLELFGLPVAIIDLRGVVLASSKWQRLCVEYHRVNEITLSRCIESDTCLSKKMQQDDRIAIYRCLNGLTDCATPIKIEGRHIANLFIGQFLLSEPDVGFFEAQAGLCGFQVDEYLQALQEVPVVSEEKIPAMLNLMTDFAHQIAMLSLSEHRAKAACADVERQVEARTIELEESHSLFEKAANVARLGFFDFDIQTGALKWDHAMFQIYGIACDDRSSNYDTWRASVLPEDLESAERDLGAAIRGEAPFYTSFRIRHRDGGTRSILSTGQVYRDAEGRALRMVGINQDVTERELADQALHREREFTRALLDNIADGVVACDAEGRLVLFNRAAREWHGLDALALPPEDWGLYYNLFESDGTTPLPTDSIPLLRAFRGETVVDAGMAIVAKGQLPRHVLAAGRPFFDTRRNLLGAVVALRDITGRKRAEEALRESGEKFKAIANCAASWEAWFNPEGKLVWMNPYSINLTGYTPEEYMAAGDYLSMVISEEDLPVAREKFQGALCGSSGDNLEVRALRKDGSKLWVSVSWRPILDSNGRSLGIRTSSQDITERKLAEQQLRQSEERAQRQRSAIARLAVDDAIASGKMPAAMHRVTEALAETIAVARASVWTLSEDGSELACLSLFEASTGEYSVEPPLKTADFPRYFEAIRAESRIYAELAQSDPRTSELAEGYLKPLGIASMLDAGILDGGALVGVVCLEHIGQTRRWHSDEESFASTAASLVAQIFANGQRRRAEEAMARAKEAAEASNRAKSDFLANMSHEIRTPMNAIIGLTYLVQRTEMTSKQRDYLSKIDTSARSLLGVINDILDFSKVDAGKLELEHAEFSLDDVLGYLADVVGTKARQKGLRITFSVAPETPRQLVGDALRLGQVLLNLAANAVKFTENGGVALSVMPEKVSGESVRLRFSVRDTGIGMTTEQVSGLFRPFSQADTSTTRKYGGTGLGLAISKQIADLMGGQIRVESEPGRGSTFTFTVALNTAMFPGRCPVRPDSSEKGGPKDVSARPAHLAGRRVLLVEDNAINRDLVVELLTNLGVSAEVAENGREGVARATAEPFDLVLMDVQMPEMDGLMAARLIRADDRCRDLPIVAMTAHAMSGDREKSLEAGMDDHITKPVHPEKLEEVLCRLIAESTPPRSAGIPPSSPIIPATARWQGGGATVEAAQGCRQDDVAPDSPCGGLPGQIHPFDIPKALARVNGDAKFLCKLIQMFHEMYASAVPELRGLAAQGGREEARRLAHSLKGAAGALEAGDVSAAASALEMAFHEGGEEKTGVLLDALDRALAPALAAAASLECEGAPYQVVPPPGPIRGDVTAGLAVLRERLATHDMDARRLFTLLSGELRGRGVDADVDEVAAKLDRLDFTSASAVLDRLSAKLGLAEEKA